MCSNVARDDAVAAAIVAHPSSRPPPRSCVPPDAVLFDGLGDDDRDALLAVARVRRTPPHRVVAIHGSRPGRCWLLLSGHVKEHRDLVDGSSVVTDVRGPGDLVGEAAMLDQVPMAVDVTSIDDVTSLAFEEAGLRRLLRTNRAVDASMRRALAERSVGAQTALVRNARPDATERVVLALLHLQERFGRDTADGRCIGVPLSQAELGAFAAMSRETTARVLRGLRRKGLVTTSRCHVVLPDVERLAATVWSPSVGADGPW